MKQATRAVLALSVLVTIAACANAPSAPAQPSRPTPAPIPTLQAPSSSPIWSDEFDGPAGATFDRAKWSADTGGSGFGNGEREFYTTRAENVALDGQGHLVITAVAGVSSAFQCWYGECGYTSSRLKTKGLFAQKYGRIEARIRIPRGQGLWPAFWMLGANIDSVGWPASGEIDIMENKGSEPDIVHGTLHGPGYSGSNGISGIKTLSSGAYADDYHTFTVVWQPTGVNWYMDGLLYHRVTPNDLPSGAAWVFDHPFFLVLNVAVGGFFPGDPDGSTPFPQMMVVDYVRVYRDP